MEALFTATAILEAEAQAEQQQQQHLLASIPNEKEKEKGISFPCPFPFPFPDPEPQQGEPSAVQVVYQQQQQQQQVEEEEEPTGLSVIYPHSNFNSGFQNPKQKLRPIRPCSNNNNNNNNNKQHIINTTGTTPQQQQLINDVDYDDYQMPNSAAEDLDLFRMKSEMDANFISSVKSHISNRLLNQQDSDFDFDTSSHSHSHSHSPSSQDDDDVNDDDAGCGNSASAPNLIQQQQQQQQELHLHDDNNNNNNNEDKESKINKNKKKKRKRKRKRKKIESFLEGLMGQVIQKQEQMHLQLMEMIDRKENERMMREQAWRIHEIDRANQHHLFRSQDAARTLSLLSAIQYANDHSSSTTFTTTASVAQQRDTTATPTPGDVPNNSISNNKWSTSEVEALISIRSALDQKFRSATTAGAKTPLWKQVSASMAEMGYARRNTRKCREKWENINKYYNKVTHNGQTIPDNTNSCPYFHHLQLHYKHIHHQTLPTTTNTTTTTTTTTAKPTSPPPSDNSQLEEEQHMPSVSPQT